MLVNCGQIGVDWERCSLSMYIEALTAQSMDPAQPDAADDPGLRRFMKAHGALES